MQIVQRGDGPPLVLVPGLQGRWEYVRPAVESLAKSVRVITFSSCDEPAADSPFDAGRGFGSFIDQIDAALDHLAIDRAIVCGVSFGGLIALRYAASKPERTARLILVSTPGPGWH